MHLGAEGGNKLRSIQPRKDTASTKAGSYSEKDLEEDQFD